MSSDTILVSSKQKATKKQKNKEKRGDNYEEKIFEEIVDLQCDRSPVVSIVILERVSISVGDTVRESILNPL